MRTKNHLNNEYDWEEGYYPYGSVSLSTKSMPSTIRTSQQEQKRSQYNSIFSDDEDDPMPPTTTFSAITTTMNYNNKNNNIMNNSGLPKWITPSAVSLTPSTTATYVDPLLSSGAYHIHQAENALSTLKHVVMEDGWKKALKHKSGVVVHMKNGLHKNDKTPIFKGEAIIQGFSPQSIFYVIGMRKLWDEQYEDGNLVENLNESTSLTYEITKPTATSKSRDFSLVERIECTQNGSIIFAATSVDTPRIPRIHGRTRAQIKLQGWILEPIRGPVPSTKVTFVIQENMKGWVPGFAKKSLARRPLVIALINDYLQKKSDRMRSQQKSSLLSPNSHGYYHHSQQRPSIQSQFIDPSKNVSQKISPTPSPTPSQRSILLGSNISNASVKKRITFAEKNVTYPSSININDEETKHQYHHQQQQEKNVEMTPNQTIHTNNNLPLLTSNSPLSALSNSLMATSKSYQQQQQQQQTTKSSSHRLYSANRHSTKKIECLKLIKQLSNSPVGWTFIEEKNNTRFYSHQHYKLSRTDSVIFGSWTPEQLCSIVNCVGARRIWDDLFEYGEIMERFSQKDYLVKWRLKNNQQLTVISTIDTDTSIGAIYTASTSVKDDKVESGLDGINNNLQLYGWIFVPMKDSLGKHGVRASIIMDVNLHNQNNNNNGNTMMKGLIQYINTHGCPPYIRRVAGKVLNEHYSLENGYEVNYIVKHEASSSYKARKPNPEKSWCTDIRIDALKNYSLGFDLLITPSQGIRVEISETVVKIFTTMADLDGKQVSIKIYPSQLGKVSYNGTTMFYIKGDNPIEKSINNNENHQASSSSLSLTPSIKTNSATPISLQDDHPINDEPLTPPSPLSSNIPTIHEPSEDHDHDQQLQDQTTTKPSQISVNQLQIPEGYMIVPHSHNNNNILILSDDLTFNGQQLAVMFLAMVICYYMGKFACQC